MQMKYATKVARRRASREKILFSLYSIAIHTALTRENSGSIIFLKKLGIVGEFFYRFLLGRTRGRRKLYEKKEVVSGYHNRYIFINSCGYFILLVHNAK